jgi:hypothetical protein
MSSISDLPTSSLQKAGIALEIMFPLLSLITVSLRVYARLTTRNFGWGEFVQVSLPVPSWDLPPLSYFPGLQTNKISSPDDGLIIVAMILAIGLAVTAIFGESSLQSRV